MLILHTQSGKVLSYRERSIDKSFSCCPSINNGSASNIRKCKYARAKKVVNIYKCCESAQTFSSYNQCDKTNKLKKKRI